MKTALIILFISVLIGNAETIPPEKLVENIMQKEQHITRLMETFVRSSRTTPNEQLQAMRGKKVPRCHDNHALAFLEYQQVFVASDNGLRLSPDGAPQHR